MIVNKYYKKSIKILCWIILSIIGLFIFLVLVIQIPVVQNSIKNKAVSYLEGKIHTPVKIGKIEIGFPKKIILENVYFQSQIGDTLFSGEKIAINLSIFKLLDDEIEIIGKICKALGHPIRIQIMTLLWKRDSRTCGKV